MTKQDLTFKIGFDTKEGVANLKKAGKEVGELGDDLDDTRTAAQRLADALDAETDDMIASIKGAVAASDSLGRALGPELAAKIGQANIDKMVGDLNRAGLSFDEIEADADRFAMSLRKVDAAADDLKRSTVGGLDDIDHKMGKVADSTDRSRSVMSGFAGSAATEIPGVTDQIGWLGEGVSQLTEGLAEGEVNLKGLVGAGVFSTGWCPSLTAGDDRCVPRCA
ncbi:MAG TPA: hypothetical protein PK020_05385 [Ilumatobacteraceae bacterium]|nr:hypothetical protein [Ilumatobacteraceae bacterium]HRB04231.1 hypothetical protein [Ilumatobacteraceae bacterium]